RVPAGAGAQSDAHGGAAGHAGSAEAPGARAACRRGRAMSERRGPGPETTRLKGDSVAGRPSDTSGISGLFRPQDGRPQAARTGTERALPPHARRTSRTVPALLAALTLCLLSGCSGPEGSRAVSPARAEETRTASGRFVDIAARSGITFAHT